MMAYLGVCKHQNYNEFPCPSFYMSNNNGRLYGDMQYRTVQTLQIASVNPLDGNAALDLNGQRFVKAVSLFADGFTNPPFGAYRAETYNGIENSSNNILLTASKAAYGVLSLGLSLTENEAVIYNNAVNNLMKVVMAM